MAKRVKFGENAAREIVRTVRTVRSLPTDVGKSKFRGNPPTSYNYTRLFELTETLSAGGTATATLVRWDSDTDDWVVGTSPDDDFDVYDFIGSMTGADGTRGIAQSMFGKWVIIQLACA